MLKKNKFFVIWVFLLVLLFVDVPVLATKTVKTIEDGLYFKDQTVANTDYTKKVNFDPPDGVSEIFLAEITIRGDFQANTIVKARVNISGTLESCSPASWTVPSQDVANYVIIFDCTNLLTQNNVLTFSKEMGFRTSKIAKNVKARLKITYYNNPPSTIYSIGGTEYNDDESAKVIISIYDNVGDPVNNADCRTTVRDSNDDILVDNKSLLYMSGSNGLYTYLFDTNVPFGVYSVDAYCNFNGTIVYTADTFHVATWTESIESSPFSIVRVSGTSYAINETAFVLIQLLRNGVPSNFASCELNMYAPNASGSKTLSNVETGNMTYLNNSNGIYQYNFDNTTYSGAYIADITCTETGYGNVPVEYANNVTDTTSNLSIEDIDGVIANITLSMQTDIFAIMSVEGKTNTTGSGSFGLRINGNVSDQLYSRAFDADEEGNIVVINHWDNLNSGSYVVRGVHNVTSNVLLTSKVNLLAFGFEDGMNRIPSCHRHVTTDTTSNAVLEDIDGLLCNITITDHSSDILVAMIFEGQVDSPNKEMTYTISIDDLDYELRTRAFSSANTKGNLNIITISDAKLSVGSHEVRGRWSVDGGTATGDAFHLVVVANQAGSREFALEKASIDVASTTATTPEDIQDASVNVQINQPNYVAGILSMSTSSGTANKGGYYLNNIDSQDGVIFKRFFSSGGKSGSIGVVETSDLLSAGSYVLKGKWYTDSSNTLSGTEITYIGISFSTIPLAAPAYMAIDFHVTNNTVLAEEIWSYENRTVNMTTIETTINNINSMVQKIRRFLDEMIFLITDAINSVGKAVGAKPIENTLITNALLDSPVIERSQIYAEENADEKQQNWIWLISIPIVAIAIGGFFLNKRGKINEQVSNNTDSIRHRTNIHYSANVSDHANTNYRSSKFPDQRES